jgi:hypothetical protein
MTADSVRAILAGRKTQTRRVLKHQPPAGYDLFRMLNKWAEFENHVEPLGKFSTACPYGIPGDRLWVREKWLPIDLEDKTCLLPGEQPFDESEWRWHSPIFMPRWASRINLEILNIRVERVQEISWEDCITEGITEHDEYQPSMGSIGKMNSFHPAIVYSQLWDTQNAKRGYPWADNPWVWVITFRVLP